MIFLKELGKKIEEECREERGTCSRELQWPYSMAALQQCWSPLGPGSLFLMSFIVVILFFQFIYLFHLLIYLVIRS